MNGFVVLIGFVLGALTLAAAVFGKRIATLATVAGWLLFVGGCFAIYGEALTFAGGWLLVASMAAFGVGIATEHDGARKRVMAGVGAVVVAAAAAGLMLDPSATPVSTTHGLLVTASWAAILASIAGALAAALLPAAGRETSWATGIAAAAGMLGAFVVGSSRTSVGELGYYIQLTGPDGPLYWQLPGVEKMPEGLRLIASAGLPAWVMWVCLGSAALVVLVSLADRAREMRKAVLTTGAVLAVCAGFLLAGITGSTTTKFPEVTPYEDYARSALLARQASEQLLSEGAFTQGSVTGVRSELLAADVGFLAFAGLIGLLMVLFRVRRDEFAEKLPGAVRRDLTARAIGFGWLAWFMKLLLQSIYLGSAGLASASEWVMAGFLLASTGLLLVAWRRDNRFSEGVAEFLPGWLVLGWVMYLAISFAFGSIPGLGLSFF